jgi:hypothetical protein
MKSTRNRAPARDRSFEDDYDYEHEKTRAACAARVLKFYPADAVQAILPFPFGKGWMTVAAEADFQSRHAIFPNNQASFVHQLSVRGRHLSREHRRVNSKAAG